VGHTHTHTHRSPTRTGPCTLNAVGLLSLDGDARVAPPCPTTSRPRVCRGEEFIPYLTLSTAERQHRNGRSILSLSLLLAPPLRSPLSWPLASRLSPLARSLSSPLSLRSLSLSPASAPQPPPATYMQNEAHRPRGGGTNTRDPPPSPVPCPLPPPLPPPSRARSYVPERRGSGERRGGRGGGL